MTDRTVGWVWVGVQAVLLVALVVLPSADHWPVPAALATLANILFFGGLALLGVAALRLGPALTPTPIPKQDGQLATTGLYAFMRHPIYTGVLITIAGMVMRSGSILHLVIGVAALVFFDRKAAWEEGRLAERYPDYTDYAARTARFIPGVW